MNWDAIGAIAELLGAIGVIGSLVYLARQIRDGQRALRAGTYQQFIQHHSEVLRWAMDDPAREQAVRLGMNDFTRLSEEDAFRFNFWMNGVGQVFDNAYYQYRVGMLDAEMWQKHYGDVRGLFQSPGVGEWWRTSRIRPNFSPEFVALVEEILAETSPSGPEVPA